MREHFDLALAPFVCFVRRIEPNCPLKLPAVVVARARSIEIKRSGAKRRGNSGRRALLLDRTRFSANDEQAGAPKFLRKNARKIPTDPRGRGLQHCHIILIEARRRQIYSAGAWREHLSPILHARFLHLSFLSRGLAASHGATVARAFCTRRWSRLLRLVDSRKISATGAAKCFDCIQKRKITARIAPPCPPPFSTIGRQPSLRRQTRRYAARKDGDAS